MPEWKTELERRNYFSENAEYFTVVNREEKAEFPTFDQALKEAKVRADQNESVYSVYAVIGTSDSWICNIKPIIKPRA